MRTPSASSSSRDAGPAPGRGGRGAPSRAELARAARRTVKSAGPGKAELYEIEHGGRTLVIKDFAGRSAPVRLAGRLQIRRECAAYRWLDGLSGVARLVGRIDAHALALEKIDGVILPRRARETGEGARLLARLGQVVAAMHRRGLAHLDLRGQDNVMVDGAGELWVLDLAGAAWFRPGGFLHRLLFPALAGIDRAALLKWKRLLDAGPYTDDERVFLRRYDVWRALWPFNRKRRARGRPAPTRGERPAVPPESR